MGLAIGQLYVRRSVLIQATTAQVWRQFSSESNLAAWFGLGHKLERYVPGMNGCIELSVAIDGKRRRFGGSICVWEPEVELSVTDDWLEQTPWPVPTAITFRLTPIYDGVQVELLHHGFERLGLQAADELQGYEQGWDLKHLKVLREIVEADL